MARKNQNARIQFKYSTISGSTPTIAPSNDHTDGSWNATDLYVGEFFLNAAEDTMWVRTLNGIVPITSGTTSINISQYVNKSGDTMTGTLNGTTFNGDTFNGDVFSGGTFYGDGSNLTGITSNGIFTGGTVNGDTEFTADVQFSGANVTLPTINGDTQIVGDLNVTGAVSATTFYGDGSQLTGLNLSGITTDTYVDSGIFTGTTLTLTKNDFTDVVITGFTGTSLWSSNVNGIHYNSGNVGIGMSASSVNTKLEISYSDASPERAFRIKNTDSNSQYNFRTVQSEGEHLLRFDSDNSGISPLVLSSASKVGVGTNAVPEATLHVRSPISSQAIVLVEDETNPDVTPFIIDYDGNVGIGNDTPTEKLDIVGNTKISGTLNIGTLGTGTSVNNLGIDASGNVVSGTTSGGTPTLSEVLIEGNTAESNNIHFNSTRTGVGSQFYSAGQYVKSGIEFDGANVKILTFEDDLFSPLWGSSEMNFTTTGLTVGKVGSVGIFRGIEYEDDYSSNYTNRSLVDKSYVDAATSGGPQTYNISSSSDIDLYNDGTIRLFWDVSQTDIDMEVLTDPITSQVHVTKIKDGTTSAYDVENSDGLVQIEGAMGNDDRIQLTMYAPLDTNYPQYRFEIVLPSTLIYGAGRPFLLMVEKINSYS